MKSSRNQNKRRGIISFLRRAFGQESGQHDNRRLQIEPLEGRQLLSINPGLESIDLFSTSSALFAENDGQWVESVHFGYNNSGTQIYFTDDSLEFGLSQKVIANDVDEEAIDTMMLDQQATAYEYSGTHFSLGFDGATPTVPIGADLAVTKFNYHIDEQSNWVDNVSTYNTVIYNDLYNGIDLHTYGKHGQMKYEFHVAPGSDYSQISLSYEGINGLSIAEDGSLHVATELGELIDEDLYIYQVINGEEIEIDGEFVLLDNNSYTFSVTGEYDPNLELVIDPELDWGTYLGGTNHDESFDVATDGDGNVYVSGRTTSVNGFISDGWDTIQSGNADGYVMKLSENGEHLWSTYLGGSGHEYAMSVVADMEGNVYACGGTSSPDWGISEGWGTYAGGREDGYIIKLSSEGNHIWSSYLGGSNSDSARSVAIDTQGNVYVGGITSSNNFGAVGGWDTVYGGGEDGFVMKLTGEGTHLWSSFIGGSAREYVLGINTDLEDNLYICGSTSSSNLGTSGGWNTTYGGGEDGYLMKMSSDGAHIWSSYIGGSSYDRSFAVAIDDLGNAYVCGDTSSSNLGISGGWDTTYDGGQDGYIVKFSNAGEHIWSSYIGGSSKERTENMTLDGNRNIYIGGETFSSGWMSSGWDKEYGGNADGFLVQFNENGDHIWSTYLGGLNYDAVWGVTSDIQGNIYVCGDTESNDWSIANSWDSTFSGDRDGYVFKFSGARSNPTVEWGTYIGQSGGDDSRGLVTDSEGNVYICGTVGGGDWDFFGGWDTTYAGGNDGFVAKFSSSGELLWGSYLGGSGYERAFDITLDIQGNVCVCGYTSSSNWGLTDGWDDSYASGWDGYVVKLTNDGSFLWGSYLGGYTGTYEQAYSVATDAQGNVFVSGRTESSDYFGTTGGWDTEYSGGGDGFLVKLSSEGDHIWSTYLGGSGDDNIRSIVIDDQGYIYGCGATYSSDWNVSGGWDTTNDGIMNGHVIKFTNDGDHVWSTFIGGDVYCGIGDLALDSQGNIYACGGDNTDGWGVAGGWDTTLGGDFDGLVVKLNNDGDHVWSTYLGGTGEESAYGIATDSQDNVYVVGAKNSYSSNWGVSGGWDMLDEGTREGFVVKLSSAGSHLWSSYVGGVSPDATYAVATDYSDNVYICGNSDSSNEWGIVNGWDTEYYGNHNDAYLLKIAQEGTSPKTAEIEVAYENIKIVDGDDSPSFEEGTDFGVVNQGEEGLTRTYRIFNTGEADLVTSNLTIPDGFTIVDDLEPIIPSDSYDDLVIQFDSEIAGTFSGEISFDNNSLNQNPFNFVISGTVESSAYVEFWIDGEAFFGIEGNEIYDGMGCSDPGHIVSVTTSIGEVIKRQDPEYDYWDWYFEASDGPVEQIVTFTWEDRFGNTGEGSFELFIDNVWPEFEWIQDQIILADQTGQYTGHYNQEIAFYDPGDDSWSVDVNWGDGSPLETIAVDNLNESEEGPTGWFVLDHVYEETNEYEVTVLISDDDEGCYDQYFRMDVYLESPIEPIIINEGEEVRTNDCFPFPTELVDPTSISASAGEVIIEYGAAPGVLTEFWFGYLPSEDSKAVELGDLNGDGYLDAFIANNGANQVWMGEDGIGFWDSGQWLGNYYSTDVSLGDLNGDGTLDAFVTNRQVNQVWINDGSGYFYNSGQNLGNYGQAAGLADLDNDGDLDAFVANRSQTRVLLNNGDGTFIDSGQVLPGFPEIYNISLGDIDGDGDIDATQAFNSILRVWANDGFGNFNVSQDIHNSSRGSDVSMGDLDGDGDLDLFVTGRDHTSHTIWINSGGGSFFDSGQRLPGDTSRFGAAISLGDLDVDGDLDAMVVSRDYTEITTWINDGGGLFVAGDLYFWPEYNGYTSGSDVSLGDLDSDGDLDAFIATRINSTPLAFMNITEPMHYNPEWVFFAEDGPSDSQEVIVSWTTLDGIEKFVTFDLIVNNVAPDIDSPGDFVTGEEFYFEFNVFEAGYDTIEFVVDWGDGSLPDVHVIESPGYGIMIIPCSHVFANGGIYEVNITADDYDGGFDSETFYIESIQNSPPVAVDDAVSTTEDSSLLIEALADNGFGEDYDVDGNLDPYATSIDTFPENGVLINNEDGTFTFDPDGQFDYMRVNDSASVNFTYRIYDTELDSDTALVAITITGVNDAPLVNNPLNDITFSGRGGWQHIIPNDSFFDVDADPGELTYLATLSNGNSLPSWIVFDPSTRTFSGNPSKDDEGSLDIKVTVEDAFEATTSDTFTLTISNANDEGDYQKPDLRIKSKDISASPINPEAGQQMDINASIINQGMVEATNVVVSFYDRGTLIGEQIIANIAAGDEVQASISTSFNEDSYRLITVEVDPLNTIDELNESNNEASMVLQIGEPSLADASIIIEMGTFTAREGAVASITGQAFYDFENLPGEHDFPMQGAQVTVNLYDPATGNLLSVFSGSHTDVNGNFRQGIIAPDELGTYSLVVELTDHTLTSNYTSTLTVIENTDPAPPRPPLPPTPPGPGTPTTSDVFIVSEGIVFSDENPDLGEDMSIYSYVQYIGAEAVEDVPVAISDLFPVAGQLQNITIGNVYVDFLASPNTSSYVVIESPWIPTANGAHIIQIKTSPEFPQNTTNDSATRAIEVGSQEEITTLSKNFELEVDADQNGFVSPGDTLRYTITYANIGEIDIADATVLDDYDERFFEAPTVSDGGVVADGTITWDLASIPAGSSGDLTYQIKVLSVSEFSGIFASAVNTAFIDSPQSSPVVTEAKVDIIGDSTPPETEVTITPEPNEAGWNNTSVEVVLTASDETGGTGVNHISYSINGAPIVEVAGSSATILLESEGSYVISYYAVDNVNNAETPNSVTVNIDMTDPVAVYSGPYYVDEGSSITISGTESYDSLSGISSIAWCLDDDGQFDDGDLATINAIDGPDIIPVSLKVVDVAGNEKIVYTSITVNNVAPMLENVQGDVIDENGYAHVTGTIVDPGTEDSFTLVIDWGEGTPITYSYPAGTTSFDESHQYLDDNPTGTSSDDYAIKLTVTDNPGIDHFADVFNAAYSSSSPTIDGISALGEWGSAYTVTMERRDDGGQHDSNLYFQHDDTYLFIGVDSQWNSGWDVVWDVWIDGDHNGDMNGNLTQPYTDIDVCRPSPSGYPGYTAYYTVPAIGEEVRVGYSSGAASASGGSSNVFYEFRIPLADLNVSPENAVGFFLSHGYDGIPAHRYEMFGISHVAPQDWATIQLDPEPSTATTTVTVNNVDPRGVIDSYQMDEDQTLMVAAPGVLGNDTDQGILDTHTVELVTDVSNGTLTLNQDGLFTYTPNTNFNGTDSFEYIAIDDDCGVSEPTTVTITVNPINDAPKAHDQTVSVTEDGIVNITLSGSDVETAEENLTFTVLSIPRGGILTDSDGNLLEEGDSFVGPPTLIYEKGASCEGENSTSFQFEVTDRGDPDNDPNGAAPETSDPAIVTINIEKAVDDGDITVDEDGVVRIGGTSGNDVIIITHSADRQHLSVSINGVVDESIPMEGLTEIKAWGREGNDYIELVDLALTSMLHGGDGNDELIGAQGSDLMFGGLGDDNLTGASGNDFLIGGEGSDRIVGSAGHDILAAGEMACSLTQNALRIELESWVADRAVDEGLIDDILDEALVTDDDYDMLTGSSGADLFIINDGDKITDINKTLKDGDVILDIDDLL